MSDIIKKGTPLDQIVEQLEGNATGNTKNIVKKINFNYDLCKDFMKNYGVPMEEIMVLNDHVKNEFECFLKVLEINGMYMIYLNNLLLCISVQILLTTIFSFMWEKLG